ncbi:MAG: hypothetical protein Q8Q18_03335 [bacterium]|nr:hypothetical protein [bacterium]
MKHTKTKIILSAIVFLSVISIASTAYAAGASLYVSPASLTKTVGDTFGVSVGFNASGNKVCAVEGTLAFNNLSCQNITLAGDVTPQSSPTCSNPYFLIGVPSCTMADKVLFTVSVKTVDASAASISSTGVDIIGEGVSVGSASISGNYTINAVPKATPTASQNGYIGYVNGQIQMFPTLEAAQRAGATGIQPNYQYYPAGTTPEPIKKPATVVSTTTHAQTAEQVNSTSSQPLAAAVVVAGTGSSIPTWAWLAILAILVIGGGWWAYSRTSRVR